MSQIAANVAAVRRRLASAARRAGRHPEEIELMAVCKAVEPPRVEAALAAGIRILGENRVQEAEAKIPLVQGEAQWHLVGRLQGNKATEAAALFAAIHSVDRPQLVPRLARVAPRRRSPLEIYLQVGLDADASDEAVLRWAGELARAVAATDGLRLRGLMTLPPYDPDPEASRPYFRRLRRIRDRLQEELGDGLGLSMGMSGDFEVAVEEGATIVRVGSAIFGPRP